MLKVSPESYNHVRFGCEGDWSVHEGVEHEGLVKASRAATAPSRHLHGARHVNGGKPLPIVSISGHIACTKNRRRTTLRASPPGFPGVLGTSLSPSRPSHDPTGCLGVAGFMLYSTGVAVPTSQALAKGGIPHNSGALP